MEGLMKVGGIPEKDRAGEIKEDTRSELARQIIRDFNQLSDCVMDPQRAKITLRQIVEDIDSYNRDFFQEDDGSSEFKVHYTLGAPPIIKTSNGNYYIVLGYRRSNNRIYKFSLSLVSESESSRIMQREGEFGTPLTQVNIGQVLEKLSS